MKRHKVTTACEACRSKKKKCDGQRPRCRPCQENNTLCSWPQFSGRSSHVSKQYIQDLESKIKELEEDQLRHHQLAHAQPTSTTSFESYRTIQSLDLEGGLETQTTSIPWQQQPSPIEAEAPMKTYRRSPSTSVASYSFQHSPGVAINAYLGEHRNFFGTASIGSFVSQIFRAIDDEDASPENNQPFHQISPVSRPVFSRQPINTTSVDVALPTRKVADSLLEVYWTFFHTIFPFLDRIEIESAYLDLWSTNGKTDNDFDFLVILNMMFALSARVNPVIPPEERTTTAKAFLNRAQKILSAGSWNLGTFQLIQAHLLLGLYFHTISPYQAWMAISQAIVTAQSLGLQIPETSENMRPTRARELMRKVWHGCIMDRILSQTYGKHPVISNKMANAVPMPLSVSEVELNNDAQELEQAASQQPNTMEFFIRSLRLYDIVADILCRFYSNRSNVANKEAQEYEHYFADSEGKSIFFYENRLQKWFDDLPDHLHWFNRTCNSDCIWTRQATILRQRFLQIRMLLLRPSLRFVVANRNAYNNLSNESSCKKLRYQLMQQCAISCVETAQEAIDTILSNGPPDPTGVGVVSAWVHNILFLYTPATVLIAARLCPSISDIITEESIKRSWENALGLLRLYKPYGSPAERAITVLLKVDEQIQTRFSKVCRDLQVPPDMMTPSSNNHTIPTDLSQSTSDNLAQSRDRMMSEVQLDSIDLSMFDVEDLSWMDGIPFNI